MRRITPVFFPMWLIDSDVRGQWQMEAGFDYQVKSSQESYRAGQWQTRDVIETRIRWETRMGQIARRYNNVAVPAVSDHQNMINWVGNYPFAQSKPYDSAGLGSSAIRIPDLLPQNSWPLAKTSLDKTAEKECIQAANAQHSRNLKLTADYPNQNWSQLLLPLYFTYYTDDDGLPQPIYINGQTGKIGGIRLASQKKGWMWAGIAAGIAVGLFIFGLILTLAGALLPPVVAIGSILIVLAILVGAFAIIPAVWPWQWNRKQRSPKIVTRGN
jgi:hypothetical protein